MKLGTYSTFDCPCVNGETLEEQANDPKNQALLEEALWWLKGEFDKIGGTVRKVMNYHEFGRYPSFEIDYPDHLEFIDVDSDDETPEEEELIPEKIEWHEKANAIEEAYCKKFSEYF